MSTALTLDPQSRLFHLPLELPLDGGGVLEGGHLAYAFAGPVDGPVVVVQGGISAGRHVAGPDGWWFGVVRPEGGIDLARFRVLGIDFLGGGGASSGPATHGGAFPHVTSVDQARATAALLDHLGIGRVHAYVGASYGGMVALAAAAYEDRYARVIAISAPDRPHPLATGWRSIQRRIVRLGVDTGRGDESLAIARGLAMTTYRGADELAARFDAPPEQVDGRLRFPIESYLEARGEAYAREATPDTFLRLSEAIDRHRVDPTRIRARTTLVGVRQDRLVPLTQLEELAARVGAHARLHTIDSPYGHDAFLKEAAALRPLLRDALGGSS